MSPRATSANIRLPPGIAATYPLPLARRQLADDVLDALAEPDVAGRAVHQCARREVMPQAVPGELLGFPPAVHGRLCGEPRVLAKPRKQPIGLEFQQILAIAIGRVLERALEQPHILKVEGLQRR